MGPIESLGFDRAGWLQRPWAVGETTQPGGAGLPGPVDQVMSQAQTQSISALSISSSVSQMMKSVGVQNSQMLELMIALMVLMAMLEQQRGGGGADALSELGKSGSAMSTLNSSISSTMISSQHTSISYTQTNITQINFSSGGGNGADGQSRIDTTV